MLLIMMSCMLILIVSICFCCHWRFQKLEERSERNNSWMQRYNFSGLYQNPLDYDEPPPDYNLIMSMEMNECSEENDPELPSYETALKLSCQD